MGRFEFDGPWEVDLDPQLLGGHVERRTDGGEHPSATARPRSHATARKLGPPQRRGTASGRESPYGGHYELLSLMLADIARKADAGLDTLDWIASLGLPVEEFCDDDDPPASEIHARMEERLTRCGRRRTHGWTRNRAEDP